VSPILLSVKGVKIKLLVLLGAGFRAEFAKDRQVRL